MLGPNDFDGIWDHSLTTTSTGDDDYDIDILSQYHDDTTAIKLAYAYLRLELQHLQYEALGDPRGHAGEVSRKKGRGEFVIPPPGRNGGRRSSGGGGPGDGDEQRGGFGPGRGMDGSGDDGDGSRGGDDGRDGRDDKDDKDDNNRDVKRASTVQAERKSPLKVRGRGRPCDWETAIVYDPQKQTLSKIHRRDMNTLYGKAALPSKNPQDLFVGESKPAAQSVPSEVPTSFHDKASSLFLKMRGKRKGINILDKPRGGHSSIGIAGQCLQDGESRKEDGILNFGSQEEEIWS